MAKRTLESFSSAVLAEWITRRGISYFEEELMNIEAELGIEWQRVPMLISDHGQAPRCPRCNGTGANHAGYCDCQMGQDLKLVESRLVEAVYGSKAVL